MEPSRSTTSPSPLAAQRRDGEDAFTSASRRALTLRVRRVRALGGREAAEDPTMIREPAPAPSRPPLCPRSEGPRRRCRAAADGKGQAIGARRRLAARLPGDRAPDGCLRSLRSRHLRGGAPDDQVVDNSRAIKERRDGTHRGRRSFDVRSGRCHTPSDVRSDRSPRAVAQVLCAS